MMDIEGDKIIVPKRDVILISGYYGFDNAGDEAVLSSISDMIKTEINGAKIAALSNNPEKTARENGITTVQRNDMKAVIKLLRRTKVFISGGGSLFQDVTGKNSVIYYGGMIHLARLFGAKVMVMSQGLGPLNGGFTKFMTKIAINRAKTVTWRDKESMNLAKSIGIKEKKMRLSCDPVLMWKPNLEDIQVGRLINGKKTAVCVRSWKGLDESILTDTIQALTEQDHKILLIPFQKGTDEEIAKRIAEVTDAEKAKVTENWARTVYKLIGQSDLVIGMRLHSLIMAAACGKSTIAVSYDPKVDAFCEENKIPIACKAESFDADKILEAAENASDEPIVSVADIKERWQISVDELKCLWEL